MWRAALACLFVLLTASGPALAGDGDWPLKRYVEGTLDNIRGQCLTLGDRKLRIEELVDRDTAQFESGRFMMCECIPERLAELARSEAAAEKVTDQQARDILNQSSEGCTILAMRKFGKPVCQYVDRPPEGVKDLTAYCDCYVAGTNAFTDQQIIDDLLAMDVNRKARARAKAEGRAQPERYASIFNPLKDSCRSKAGFLP